MDCHIQSAVETGYERMFGAGGAFGYVLTAMLTIYVALIAYGFMTGRTRLTLTMMSPRVITMVLVLSFLSVYPAYHAVFYGLLMNGPDEITAVLLGQKGSSAIYHFADALDGLFVKFAEIAKAMDTSSQNGVGILDSKSTPVNLFWLSGLLLMFSTLGVLILSRLVLYLLLIIGPIFILLGLFPQTRGLFNGWIRTALIFAMVPMLTVLGGSAALTLFVPLIEAIAFDPTAAVKQVQPMIILFMGSVIYAAFMLVLMWVASSLVRDWQAALRKETPPDRADGGGATLIHTTGAVGAAGMAYASTGAVSGASFERTEPIVSAIVRDAAGTGNSRVDSAQWQTAPVIHETGRRSRVEGLGQRFRPKPQTAQRSDVK
jgi:type IV secretion system protein VirB6